MTGDDQMCNVCGHEWSPKPNGKCVHCDGNTSPMTVGDLVEKFRAGDLWDSSDIPGAHVLTKEVVVRVDEDWGDPSTTRVQMRGIDRFNIDSSQVELELGRPVGRDGEIMIARVYLKK